MMAHSAAGAAGQRPLGVAVARGMTTATVLGVSVIPALCVLVQSLAKGVRRTTRKRDDIATTTRIH